MQSRVSYATNLRKCFTEEITDTFTEKFTFLRQDFKHPVQDCKRLSGPSKETDEELCIQH